MLKTRLVFKNIFDIINIIAVTILCLYIVKIIYWNNMPPIFRYAHSIGVVFDRLSLAFISGTIFYDLTVVRKRIDSEFNFIINSEHLVEEIISIMKKMSDPKNKINNNKIIKSKTDLLKSLTIASASQNNSAPAIYGVEINCWKDYYYHQVVRISEILSKIESQLLFLGLSNPVLYKSIININESRFFKSITKMNHGNKFSMKSFIDDYILYQEDIFIILNYYKEFLQLSDY